MNVLSLFDGMSCGQIALRELEIPVETYYASEIDKHAIKQTQLNFPDTVQLGDVEKWREWNIDWKSIDLVLAGSPCQGFSFAGLQLAFNDPRSRLFFVFVKILNHIRALNPDVKFLLENVNMKREYLRVITEHLGVFPVNINSALVSAQNRNRWYWTNIRTKSVGLFGELHSDIPQPLDEGIVLRDVLEDTVVEKYYLNNTVLERLIRENKQPCTDKARCLTGAGGNGAGNNSDMTFISVDGKAPTQRAGHGGDMKRHNYQFIIQQPRGKNKGGLHEEKSPTLSANTWEQNNHVIQLNPSTESNGKQPYQQNRVYDVNGKAPAHLAGMSCGAPAIVHNMMPRSSKNGRGGTGHLTRADGKTYCLDTGQTNAVELQGRMRRLTPTECARLQTIPEWYRWDGCSGTQQYRMLSNGWTIKVITHILKNIRL